MSRRRRSAAPIPSINYPQYEWALDLDGQPVHISQAERGGHYACPVCHGRMIAKLGDIKQHHYAHDELQVCKPEEVARVAGRRWLALELAQLLDARQAVMITWPCPLCQHSHTANLLHNVDMVREPFDYKDMQFDVALLDESEALLGAVMLSRPPQEMLLRTAARKIMTLVIDLGSRRLAYANLETFLAGARIYGGVCTTQRSAADSGVLTDEHVLRRILTAAVSEPPYYVYGPLEHHADLTHVFRFGDQKLWLPPILWQRAIGGLHHSINPALQIISQEWEQPDGATIALYYVTAHDTHAIAVRRFAPGEPVYARLNPGVLQTRRLTALAVARSFAVG